MELIDLLRKQGGQYLRDIMPGGLLSPEIPPEMPTQTLKGLLGITPVVGDAISGYDAIQSAREGNYGEAALNALGVLPFVPAMGGVVKSGATPELLNSLYKPAAIRRSLFAPSDIHATMTPEDFLKLATPLIEGKNTKKRVDELKKVGKFDDVPYLELTIGKNGKPTVVDHEGRHRARSLSERGVSEMAVVLVQSPEYRKQFPKMSADEWAKQLEQSGEIVGELGAPNVVKYLK